MFLSDLRVTHDVRNLLKQDLSGFLAAPTGLHTAAVCVQCKLSPAERMSEML